MVDVEGMPTTSEHLQNAREHAWVSVGVLFCSHGKSFRAKGNVYSCFSASSTSAATPTRPAEDTGTTPRPLPPSKPIPSQGTSR